MNAAQNTYPPEELPCGIAFYLVRIELYLHQIQSVVIYCTFCIKIFKILVSLHQLKFALSCANNYHTAILVS